ncbi:MAG: ABC transporter permease, partial [Arthrobacter sp.]|nr:ABC transporter permease [Arthrobacter sp.]
MATVPLPTRPRPATPETALPPSNARRKAPTKHRRPGSGREQLSGWGMIAPAAVLLLAFIFIPAILGFGLAFTNARLISPRPVEFVGVDNFARLFSDPTFYRALLNVAYFTVVIVPVQSGLALVMALLINKKFRGVNF